MSTNPLYGRCVMSKHEKAAEYIPKIKTVKLFQYLSNDELENLLEAGEIVSYAPDEKIINQGDVSQYLFAVLKGGVNVSITNLGEEVSVSTIGKGEMFGEAAIFIGEKRTANVTSSEDTVVLRIHKADLLTFIKQFPNAGIKILMLVVSGLLRKLREANFEIAFEKQSYSELDDIDPMIKNIIDDSWSP